MHLDVLRKIAAFHTQYPNIRIAVDGHVAKDTIELYAASGASIFCSNTAIFKEGDAGENIRQLALLAHAGRG